MRMTDLFRNIMTRKINRKDRIQFASVLLVFAGLFFYMKHVRYDVPVEDFIWGIAGVFVVLLTIVLFKSPGNSIIRGWLLISSIIGKIIFSAFLFIVYFLFLVPLFGAIKLFTKRSPEASTNWSKNTASINDYKKMG